MVSIGAHWIWTGVEREKLVFDFGNIWVDVFDTYMSMVIGSPCPCKHLILLLCGDPRNSSRRYHGGGTAKRGDYHDSMSDAAENLTVLLCAKVRNSSRRDRSGTAAGPQNVGIPTIPGGLKRASPSWSLQGLEGLQGGLRRASRGLQGASEGLQGGFKGAWGEGGFKRAWEGLQGGFKGAWEGLQGGLRRAWRAPSNLEKGFEGFKEPSSPSHLRPRPPSPPGEGPFKPPLKGTFEGGVSDRALPWDPAHVSLTLDTPWTSSSRIWGWGWWHRTRWQCQPSRTNGGHAEATQSPIERPRVDSRGAQDPNKRAGPSLPSWSNMPYPM